MLNLPLAQQIWAVVQAARFQLCQLHRILPFILLSNSGLVVGTALNSHADYANMLYLGLLVGQLDHLQKLQNAAVTLIVCLRKRDCTAPGLRSHHWL